MGKQSQTRLRGIALLAVLGFIVIASSAVIATARIASTSGLAIRQHHDALLSTDLLNSLRSACTQWLTRQADTASAEAGVPYGGITVLSDRVERVGQSIDIRITAYDQDTRIPLERLSELDISQYRGLLTLEMNEPLSLQGLEAKLIRESQPIAVFPNSRDQPAVLGLARSPGLTPGSRMSSATLNPRTVPYELVRAIYGDSAEQVLKELTAWRSRADRTNPSGQRNFTTSETPSSGKIAWTTETQAWAFRLDLKTDNRQLAFWAVYELEPGIGWRLRTWHRIGDASK